MMKLIQRSPVRPTKGRESSWGGMTKQASASFAVPVLRFTAALGPAAISRDI